jgi:hypothetical protein
MKKAAALSLPLAFLLLAVAFAVTPGVTSANGPDKAGKSAALTFTKDVAPILQKNCVACHRAGESAPMSLMTYKEARPWARSIREKVVERAMPPWYADPRHGEFANDRRLSQKDIDTLVAWVDQGAKEGDLRHMPPAPKFSEGWQIGTPDATFTLDGFPVPAQGVVRYQYLTVEMNLTEDKWVQAAEIRPGDRSVVHHVIITVQEPGSNSRRNPEGMLVGMAPGMPPMILPAGHAKLIKAGSKLVFQMHYTPSGKATVDRTSVGLIFAKGPVTRKVITTGAFQRNLAIPAGDANHEVKASYTFKEDARILSLMPHMHLRGKDFEYRAVFPDGTSKVLLSVPRYNFNWQLSYVLKEPLLVPKGSRIDCVAHFDNSAANKYNPDPTAVVKWGQQTWEEMMIGWIDMSPEKLSTARPDPAATPTDGAN